MNSKQVSGMEGGSAGREIGLHYKVLIESKLDLGFGEVIEAHDDGQTLRVAFYGGPDTHVVYETTRSDTTYAIVERETRAFLRRDTGFVYGRVISCADEIAHPRSYYVQFQGERKLTLLRETEFRVKATGIPSDPVCSLQMLGLESPFLYDLRSSLMRDLLALRETTRGFDGIASAKVDFYAHQVQIARQILSDVRIRYLLADEVGLGKTIETGMILRQILLDTPHVRWAVFVPRRLVHQWRKELENRFYLDGDRVQSHLCLSEPGALERIDILIVDEAHHLLEGLDDSWQGNAHYESVRQAIAGIPHVLLLSATPVLHRERELLALLNLLDPRAFPLDQVNGFKEIITSRQTIGRSLLALATASKSFSQRRHLTSLAQLLPDDPVLRDIANRLLSVSTEELPELARQAVAHVSETYRLYRRMLRTRRDWLVSELGFQGRVVFREPDEYSLAEDDMSDLWGLLEDFRIELQARCRTRDAEPEHAQAAYFRLLESLSTEPGDLPLLAEQVRGIFGDSADDLLGKMSRLSKEVKSEGVDRPDLLREVMVNRANRDSSFRYVVFCSDESIPAIEAALSADPNIEGVYAILGTETDELNSIDATLDSEDLVFLIAGESMEEGANLQAFDGIIFYDLPWSPMRMEQRVGRLDRIVRSTPIRCASLLSAENDLAIDGVWLHVLEEGFGLFSRSLSDLQFLVECEIPRLREVLFQGGPAALVEQVPRLREAIDEERLSLDEQDVIDGTRHRADDAVTFRDSLVSGDELAPQFRESFLRFVRDGLRLRWSSSSGLQPRRDRSVPLVPLTQIAEIAARSRGRNTFNREEAVEVPEGTNLIRPGHPLVSLCDTFLRNDDRGRAFAMYRVRPNVQKDIAVFRVTVLSRVDIQTIEERLGGGYWDEQNRAGLLRLVRGWVSDFLTEVFVLEDGTPADDSLVKICRETYDKDMGDVNLGKERAAFIVDRFGSQRWASVVYHVAQEAVRLSASCRATQARLSAARDSSSEFFAKRKAVLKAMSNRGDRQAAEACSETEELSDLVDALLDGLQVSIDSIGMYYISPVPIEQNWGDDL